MDKGTQPRRRPPATFSRFGAIIRQAPRNPDGNRKERRAKKHPTGFGGFHIGSKSRTRTSTGRTRKRRLTTLMAGGAFGGRTITQRKARVAVVGDCVTTRAQKKYRGRYAA